MTSPSVNNAGFMSGTFDISENASWQMIARSAVGASGDAVATLPAIAGSRYICTMITASWTKGLGGAGVGGRCVLRRLATTSRPYFQYDVAVESSATQGQNGNSQCPFLSLTNALIIGELSQGIEIEIQSSTNAPGDTRCAVAAGFINVG